jgi:hypothetical protein
MCVCVCVCVYTHTLAHMYVYMANLFKLCRNMNPCINIETSSPPWKIVESLLHRALFIGFSTGPHCSYRGTKPALSGHTANLSLSFISCDLPPLSLPLIPNCMPTTHAHSFSPTLLVSLPNTQTYEFYPHASISAKPALWRWKHSPTSPVSYWLFLVFWNRQ